MASEGAKIQMSVAAHRLQGICFQAPHHESVSSTRRRGNRGTSWVEG